MEEVQPRIFENREFVEFEEEDIRRLNRMEAEKFDRNPELRQVMETITAEVGERGRWEEQWVTVDHSGRRVYARIYRGPDRVVAVTADGRIVRDFDYSPRSEPGPQSIDEPSNW
ncbi:MAG TPA: hypothetical protein VF531_14100 [Bacillota bacterium]